MASFKSNPFKMVSVEGRVVKFDKNGNYSTVDKEEIKAFKGAKNVTETKSSTQA